MAALKESSLASALVRATRTCQACGAVAERATCGCGAKLKARPVKDVIAQALETWISPTGKTPRATAHAVLLTLQRKGLVAKPAPGMVAAAFPKT